LNKSKNKKVNDTVSEYEEGLMFLESSSSNVGFITEINEKGVTLKMFHPQEEERKVTNEVLELDYKNTYERASIILDSMGS